MEPIEALVTILRSEVCIDRYPGWPGTLQLVERFPRLIRVHVRPAPPSWYLRSLDNSVDIWAADGDTWALAHETFHVLASPGISERLWNGNAHLARLWLPIEESRASSCARAWCLPRTELFGEEVWEICEASGCPPEVVEIRLRELGLR